MQMTVKTLAKLCQEEIAAGNGDKFIVISDDNEGNAFHGLFYGFTSVNKGEEDVYPISDSRETDYNNIIVLG